MDATETETDATEGGTGGGELQLEQRQGQAPPDIQVENLQITRTDGGGDAGAHVTGTITNAGDTTYEEREVQVTLLDNTDDVLGDVVGYRVDVDTDIDEGFDVDWNLNATGNTTGNATGNTTNGV